MFSDIDNEFGEIGDGTTTDSHVPVAVTSLAAGALAVSAGPFHTCAVTSGGAALCWGENAHYQLGSNSGVTSPSPVAVTGLSSGVTSISAGTDHTCAVVAGAALCWGRNDAGQLGIDSLVESHVPAQVKGLTSGVTAVAAGFRHTCAVAAGAVKCWGDNSDGQLGADVTTESHIPVDVVGLPPGVLAVTTGSSHSCALTAARAVKCWGKNSDGQLGNNATLSTHVPVDVIGLSSGVLALVAGSHHTCAVDALGAVKCWGDNISGQLGNNSTGGSRVPVDVKGLSSGYVAVAAGSQHSCALAGTGVLRCWGDNMHGALGNDSTTPSLVPVDVTGY